MDETKAQKIDTQLADLWEQLGKAQSRLSWAVDRLHSGVGDNRSHEDRIPTWKLTYQEAMAKGRQMVADKQHGRCGVDIPETFEAIVRHRDEIGRIQQEIVQLDKIYAADPWPRYHPCETRDGHIHSSLRGCSTVRITTAMRWRPDLSGKPVADAVADLGEALCSFCYPDAPSDWRSKTLGQVRDERTRAEREAAKAGRDAVKNAKRLAENEVFRTEYGHDVIETVAACKDLIRRPIVTAAELAWYRSPAALAAPGWDAESLARVTGNIASHLIQQTADAQRAEQVLLAREARHEGWGATEGEIARIRASAARRAAKDWPA